MKSPSGPGTQRPARCSPAPCFSATFCNSSPGPEPPLEEVQREAQQAIALFTPTGDERGLAEAWMALTAVHWFRCHFAAAAEATERAASHARRAGNTRLESVALGRHVIATQSGPAPVRDGILLCESVLRERGDLLVVKAWAIDALALFK